MKSIQQFLEEVSYPKDLSRGQCRLFGSKELAATELKQIANNNNISPMNNGSFDIALKYANELHARKIDITDDPEQWIRIAYAFANSYGEKGRELFHLVSSAGFARYSKDESDKRYDYCLRTRRKPDQTRVTVATFMKLAKDAGVDFPRN
jgi:hypothetical protein